MDSVLLASRIEPNWPAASYMGKIPPSYNHHHDPSSNNSNSKPKLTNNNAISLNFPRNQHQAPAPHQFGDERRDSTASDDDASSLNRKPMGFSSSDWESNLSHCISFDIATFSPSELRLLKSRLLGELEKVRSLADSIDSRDSQMRGIGKSYAVKEKRVSGIKRPMLFSPGRKGAKQMVVEEMRSVVGSPEVMKMCKQMLTKLMRQKYSWVFNKPVDVEGLKLYDYYEFVKQPMDLGTVKSKLSRNLYPSPDEFAADIRLTFNNAMLYNPVGQDVHNFAREMLAKFEELFVPICKRFEVEKRQQRQQFMEQQSRQGKDRLHPHPRPHSHAQPPLQWRQQANQANSPQDEKHSNLDKLDNEEAYVDEVPGSSWSNIGSPVSPSSKRQDKPVEPRLEQPLPPQAVPAPAPAEPGRPLGRAGSGKLPKPKAKDPNKREMTMEEKHRLGTGLQSLPDEKMAVVIQIVKKRNEHLTQDGDEIELDIEAVDIETLWELDRFLTNYKKAVSKIRRQALMPINNAVQNESNTALASVRKAGEIGEEDVDIGDEMPMSHFPPVEIEKDDEGHAASGSSSSSSSSSSGSSSSDSDSGSSSGSDSNIEDAMSWDNGPKKFHDT